MRFFLLFLLTFVFSFAALANDPSKIDSEKYGYVFTEQKTGVSWYYDKRSVIREPSGLVTVNGISVSVVKNISLLVQTTKKLNCKSGYGQTADFNITEFHNIDGTWITMATIPRGSSPVLNLMVADAPVILKEYWNAFCGSVL